MPKSNKLDEFSKEWNERLKNMPGPLKRQKSRSKISPSGGNKQESSGPNLWSEAKTKSAITRLKRAPPSTADSGSISNEKSAQTKNNIRSTPDNQYKINAQIHQQDSSSSLALSIATTIDESENVMESKERENELHHQLKDTLAECSRQRLRALHMSLRRQANSETRINQKDLDKVFQENQIKVSSRAFQLLCEVFGDSYGINFDKMWKSLVTAQCQTGRDSVLAQERKHEINSDAFYVTPEQRDADLISRIEKQLTSSRIPYNIDKLKNACQKKDSDKVGKVRQTELHNIFMDQNFPVYGALLNSLLKRCDDEKSGNVSWPELMSFIETAHQNLKSGKSSTVSLNASLASLKTLSSSQSGKKPSRQGSIKSVKSSATKKGETKSPATNIKSKSPRPKSTTPLPKSDAPRKIEDVLEKDEKAEESTQKEVKETKPEKVTDKGSYQSDKLSDRQSVSSVQSTISQADKTKAVAVASMKTPSAGSRADSESSVPLIQVDRTSDTIIEEAETESKKETPVSSPKPSPKQKKPETSKEISTEIKGKKLKYWPSDDVKSLKISTDPPKQRLKLEWIYGYQGNTCRSNIHVLKSGEIVYFIGTCAVLYNRDTDAQRHYREHTEAVTCMALHPNGVTVATGQKEDAKEKSALIRVWRSDTLQTLHIIGNGILKKSVLAVSFSKGKERLCGLDANQNHNLGVWDVSTGNILVKVETGIENLLNLDFNPKNSDIIVTIGKEHIGWWTIYLEGKTIQMTTKPDYQNFLRARFITSMFHTEKGDLITGDSNGTVYIWGQGGNVITNFLKHIHDGSVFSILTVRGHIITGGRDGIINCFHWSKNMDKMGTLQVPRQEGGIRMLQIHRDLLLIGTTTNSILTATLAGTALKNPFSGVFLNEEFLTAGHFDDVKSLAVPGNPENPEKILSAGVDGNICLYDIVKKSVTWKYYMKGLNIDCFDINQDTNMMALGLRTAFVFIFTIAYDDEGHVEMTDVGRIKVSTEKITCIKISPNCEQVLVGDIDGQLHSIGLKTNEENEEYWDVLNTIKAHDSPISAVDWSEEKYKETYIFRASAKSMDMSIWDGSNFTLLEDKSVRNMRWWTANCLTSYEVSGLIYFNIYEKNKPITNILMS
ncbi:DgyrCDS10695 [Dimorphilus gyrociliatus]|uniref:DgyrCDS10695 n=1 Tax=Dimorphilus gyrociliatus TaxID=2664684 RepID=A0A7I8W2Y5_9ANNE|nr:DgyrCDS10695 [Dimorphilus gyrociliatus]